MPLGVWGLWSRSSPARIEPRQPIKNRKNKIVVFILNSPVPILKKRHVLFTLRVHVRD